MVPLIQQWQQIPDYLVSTPNGDGTIVRPTNDETTGMVAMDTMCTPHQLMEPSRVFVCMCVYVWQARLLTTNS